MHQRVYYRLLIMLHGGQSLTDIINDQSINAEILNVLVCVTNGPPMMDGHNSSFL